MKNTEDTTKVLIRDVILETFRKYQYLTKYRYYLKKQVKLPKFRKDNIHMEFHLLLTIMDIY